MTSELMSKILPLENGDRLTRAEFERRYHQMPQVKKAELIEGVVYMASPVRVMNHSRPHSLILGWLMTYDFATPEVMGLDNPTVRLDLDNEPQPDVALRLSEARGGRSRISADDYLEGAPELIVEIASSSAAYDLHDKLQVYRRNEVQEYLVWVVPDAEFRWYVLNTGKYVLRSPDADGIIKSSQFPGLWLNVAALLKGEMQSVLNTVQNGLQSIEHQNFVKMLTSAAEETLDSLP